MIDITWEEINDIVSKAQTMERERIIAILEAELPEVIEDAYDFVKGIQEVIAHIKGENK